MSNTHFFSSEKILQSIFHNPWKKSWWKNEDLSPKCVFRGPILLHKCFWGQMPIFWWVTLIFLPLDHFFNLFKGISKKKGHFFADECPFFLSKCPFFFGIPLKRLKKWSRDKKMSVTHQKMGIWPRKHLWRSLWPLKTHLGVKSPFFYLKGPLLFLGVKINRLKNLLREKKCVSPSK